MDTVPLTRSVLFIGDYFSLITTVELHEELRWEGESDEDFACRLAGQFMKQHYGWDIASAAQQIGVADPEDLG